MKGWKILSFEFIHDAVISFQTFSGNIDRNTVVKQNLTSPFRARFVRFRPKTWNHHISMRVELYGCEAKGTLYAKISVRKIANYKGIPLFQVHKVLVYFPGSMSGSQPRNLTA